MADRTQLKAADHNHIADDDPFAELTRIMGFDPRQPARPQAPAVENAAPAKQAAVEDDFDIDLEKEMMGEFDAVEDSAPVSHQATAHQAPQAASPQIAHEPAFEAAGVAVNDDELAASFEQDFVFDDAADLAHFATPRAPEPAAAFDKAVAGSLDVSPVEDDLAIDHEMAASLDQDFRFDHRDAAVAHRDAAEVVQSASEAAFDADFDNAVQMSLEDELAFDSHEPEPHAVIADARQPEAHAAADRLMSEEDFAGHFDEAMADVDMDFERHGDLPHEEEPPVEPEPAVEMAHFAAHPEPVVAAEPVADAAGHGLDDDFDLSFRDALAEPEVATAESVHEVPVAEPAAVPRPSFAEPSPVQPAPVPQVAAVEPAKPVAAASERSLEDELNALLGAMTARPMPVVKEAAPAPQPVVHASAGYEGQEAAHADDLDWTIDEEGPRGHEQADQPADADLDTLLAGELDQQDFHVAPSTADPEPDIDFDDEAFDAAFTKGIAMDRETPAVAPVTEASSRSWASSLDRPRSEPAPSSWSRATPVAAPAQALFEPLPAPSAPPAPAPAYRAEPAVDHSAYNGPAPAQASFAPPPAPSAPQMAAAPAYSEPAADYSAYTPPASAPQPRQHEEMPEVETVDVPERVVALADDLDIPELSFEEDQPATPAYDDLDAEFASLLTEMNATEIAPTAAPSRAYEDDTYSAGYRTGYDRRELRAETPAAPAAAASYAVPANDDYDADDLPGSRPVSQADEFAADELDYDPELDEAMAIPGLAQGEAAKPRRRGLIIAAVVGAVAVAGGLGALAFGGKGGSEAPVIVKADNAPIKVKPENPGGAVVPNQDNKVYDSVVKGGGAKPAEPVQPKLVTNTEQPVDLASKAPQSRVVDLSPNGTDAAAGADASGNPAAAAPGSAQATAPQSAQPAAPAPKSEDRIAQVLQDADKGTNTDVVAVAPRKVKTMMVKPDGSLVPREDPVPAAPKVAAAEPTDPAPQHVAPAGQSDTQQTGTVTPATDQAADQGGDNQPDTVAPLKPAAKAEAKAQSANTPAKVPVAPPRPSDQPVDIVGEVKPDQVASVDPAAAGGGSWSMQIASQPTVESAQSTYQDLQRRYGSVLAGRTANIVKAEVAGKGTFYRVRVPAQSRNDAIALCTSYKAAGGNCFVSR